MAPLSRRELLATASVALVGSAGCVGDAPVLGTAKRENGGDGRQETPGSPETVNGVPLAGSQLPVENDFEELQNEIRDGGPPKDGIPSIDEPSFWDAEAADSELDDRDVVFGLVHNGEVKAYPQKVLVQHEITNDVVGDEPVAVTYCPLTATAMGFRRGETTFGVSGDLLNNNLVMYDRETDSRWPQILGTAISGEFKRESLQEFRLVWTRWEDWKAAHPDTAVLSTDTGYARNYNRDPYGSYVPDRAGYYIQDSTLFPRLTDDDTFPAKHIVIGARTPDGAVAFEKDALREKGLLSGTLGRTPHVAVYDPEIDTAYVYQNPDGASFSYEDGQAVAEDGTSHDPADLPLDRVYAFDAMWFAWSGFYPSTQVVQ